MRTYHTKKIMINYDTLFKIIVPISWLLIFFLIVIYNMAQSWDILPTMWYKEHKEK